MIEQNPPSISEAYDKDRHDQTTTKLDEGSKSEDMVDTGGEEEVVLHTEWGGANLQCPARTCGQSDNFPGIPAPPPFRANLRSFPPWADLLPSTFDGDLSLVWVRQGPKHGEG